MNSPCDECDENCTSVASTTYRGKENCQIVSLREKTGAIFNRGSLFRRTGKKMFLFN